MTDDGRVIWSYTEGHLREWMEGMHEEYQDGRFYQFPDPASLSSEQVDELYRRIKHILDIHMDFPDQGIEEYAWQSLETMDLINTQPASE